MAMAFVAMVRIREKASEVLSQGLFRSVDGQEVSHGC